MPTRTVQLIAIRRIIQPDQAVVRRQRGRRFSIQPDNGSGEIVYLPYASPSVRHSDLGGKWTELQRPGLDDLLLPSNSPVWKMSFTAVLADSPRNTSNKSTAWTLLRLAEFHRARQRVRVSYASFESGLWYISGMEFESAQRDPATDEITQASLDLEFTKASDVVDGVGPVTGGVKPPSAPAPLPPPPQQQSARTHVVVKGDTLWDISIKFYGTGTRWKEIGDANGVKDPRLLQIGTVLRIP